jgi:uncharacterized protein YjbI with pentapeptide repeats
LRIAEDNSVKHINREAPEPEGENHAGDDLSGHHLFGLDLRNANFDGAKIWKANLDETRLSKASFVGADLRSSRFYRSVLDNVTFDDANMNGTVLIEARVTGASFSGADLRFSVLRDLRDWENISAIQGANIYEVIDPPPGFVDWALDHGAIQEAPPPTKGDLVADKIINGLKTIGLVMNTISHYLKMMPFHPKQNHIRVVRRGPKAIAKWRARNDRSFMDLQGAKFPKARLPGAQLGGANMRDVDLTGANLEGAVLGAYMEDAQLPGADLRHAYLTGSMQRVNFREADLMGASLCMTNLTEADLEGARLAAADVTSTALRKANLRNTDFHQADLDDSHLDGAALQGARLTDVKMYMASLKNCDLSDVDLSGANLTEADLEGVTNFEEISDIEGASIHGVRNAPDGFVEWALSNGAVDEARNRSWTTRRNLKQQSDEIREEKFEKRKPTGGRILWLHILMGLVIVCTGPLAMYNSGIKPILKAIQMFSWQEAPCEVLSADYSAKDMVVLGVEMTEYRPNVQYRYDWEGKSYTNNDLKHLQIMEEPSVKRIIENYPPGESATCYVNPRSPDQSVIAKATFEWSSFLVILITLVWTLVGAALLWFASGIHYF